MIFCSARSHVADLLVTSDICWLQHPEQVYNVLFLLPFQTYFQRLSLKESHEVPLVAHFGLSGCGISGAGLETSISKWRFETSFPSPPPPCEVFWVRRLQRRRVPVTKVLGSNATMIPAALAWAVELKVRHIADFVDQKMDMLLVPTRPRGCWGWGLSEGSSAEKNTIFLDKIRWCRRFEVRLMISPGPKKESELIEPHCFFEGSVHMENPFQKIRNDFDAGCWMSWLHPDIPKSIDSEVPRLIIVWDRKRSQSQREKRRTPRRQSKWLK